MSSKQIEIIEIDRKYEGYRIQSFSREKILLGSIAERGIDEAVFGVNSIETGKYILLDGFKRLRCAIRLGHTQIVFASNGEDEADCILHLIRMSNAKGLTMLEQAKLVDELNRVFSLSVAEISMRLQRSKAWVIVRIRVLSEMSSKVMDEIIAGRFPLYSYIYTLRPVRRLTGAASQKPIENFVSHVSGHGLSTREIELLSDGYFLGGTKMKEEIEGGNLGWCLEEMKRRAEAKSALPAGLNENEKRAIRDLEFMSQLTGRLPLRLTHRDLKSGEFYAEAVVIVGELLRLWPEFTKGMKDFYDRCGVAEGNRAVAPTRNECSSDEPHTQSQSEHDSSNH
jgi:ParB/RepB/Spo0J family partition protein